MGDAHLDNDLKLGVSTPVYFSPIGSVTAAAILFGTSNWYALADNRSIDVVECAFLRGAGEPTINEKQGFAYDGIEFKARIDFGCKAVNHRGIYSGADT